MIVYRLSREQFKNDLSGKGAQIAGGRWNSVGTALLYTSANRALSTTEIAVHTPFGIVPKDYFLIIIQLPDTKMLSINIKDLPVDWNTSPPLPSTKKFGDQFASKKNALILKVPSAVVQGEFNFLINPKHPDFDNIKIIRTEHFHFDKRLFNQ